MGSTPSSTIHSEFSTKLIFPWQAQYAKVWASIYHIQQKRPTNYVVFGSSSRLTVYCIRMVSSDNYEVQHIVNITSDPLETFLQVSFVELRDQLLLVVAVSHPPLTDEHVDSRVALHVYDLYSASVTPRVRVQAENSPTAIIIKTFQNLLYVQDETGYISCWMIRHSNGNEAGIVNSNRNNIPRGKTLFMVHVAHYPFTDKPVDFFVDKDVIFVWTKEHTLKVYSSMDLKLLQEIDLQYYVQVNGATITSASILSPNSRWSASTLSSCRQKFFYIGMTTSKGNCHLIKLKFTRQGIYTEVPTPPQTPISNLTHRGSQHDGTEVDVEMDDLFEVQLVDDTTIQRGKWWDGSESPNDIHYSPLQKVYLSYLDNPFIIIHHNNANEVTIMSPQNMKKVRAVSFPHEVSIMHCFYDSYGSLFVITKEGLYLMSSKRQQHS